MPENNCIFGDTHWATQLSLPTGAITIYNCQEASVSKYIRILNCNIVRN